MNCGRCEAKATTILHTGFGLEHLCAPCRDAVRRDGLEIAAPYPLTLEDFAAWQSWKEYVRLSGMCLDMRKSLQYILKKAKQGEWVLHNGKRTEWTAMLEQWHRQYLAGGTA